MDIIEELKKRVAEFGTQAALAKDIGITPQYLSDVLRGRRTPGPAIRNYLDVERVYRPIGEQA